MVRVTKDVLRQLQAAVGKLDICSSKVFTGFVGRFHMSDRLFHGELRYAEVGDDPPNDTVSIQSILSPDSAAKPVKHDKSSKSSKPANPDEPTDKEK